MSAVIISAFPGCGKTTYYKKWSQYSHENIWRRDKGGYQAYNNVGKPCGLKILDSDSSEFSWIYTTDGVKTDARNPHFPDNYIQHIKDRINTEDVIFVSSHKVVRDALKEAGIEYYLVFPNFDLKEEWMERFKKRGSSEQFIKLISDNWETFINEMMEETFPKKIILGPDTYGGINVSMIHDLVDHVEICNCCR